MSTGSFIFGGNTGETPESLKRKRAIADALRGEVLGQAPKNVGEGLTAIGRALIARSAQNKAEAAGTAAEKSRADAMSPILSALGGGSASSTASPFAVGGTTSGSSSGGSSNYRDAIASIESAGSGDYSAVGPTHSKMGRALGRYQVMESNIPEWSKAALGREISADEFLKNPGLQDAIFDHRFGSYVQKYGNPQDAASMWFTGRPAAEGANKKDVLGTTGAAYVSKFSKALGQGGGVPIQPQAVQVASLDPSIGLPAANTPAPQGGNAYANIPARDSRGEDQQAKFRQWNSNPQANEAANLAQIDPALRGVIERAREISGQPFVLGSGLRTPEQQKQAVQWGWSGTEDSDHLGGGASDLWPVDANGAVAFDPSKQRAVAAAMSQAAKERGVDLDVGANWKNPDMPHLAISNQTPMLNAPIPTARPVEAGGTGPQVASLDPSIGLPAPSPASVPAAPAQAAAAMPEPGPNVFPPAPAPAPQTAPIPSQMQTTTASNIPDLNVLYGALQNPWLSETDRSLIGTLIAQKQKENDPARLMEMEKNRIELDRLRNPLPEYDYFESGGDRYRQNKRDPNAKAELVFDAPDQYEYKEVNGKIYRTSKNGGAVEDVTPGPANGEAPAFRFSGNSVEAQALNGLMDSKVLTPQQAQSLAAGKTITNPLDGSIMFMTPEGVFGQNAAGQQVPIQPDQAQPARQPTPSPSRLFDGQPLGARLPELPKQTAAPASVPTAPAPAPAPQPKAEAPARPGMITLTGAKVKDPTVDEKASMTYADRLQDAEVTLGKLGAAQGRDLYSNNVIGNNWIPDTLEGYLVSSDFQQFDQAKRNFINAQLRKESGASISLEEFANANRQYFPQPGESDEQIALKAANRRTAIEGMIRASGSSYKRRSANGGEKRTSTGATWRIEQ